MASTNFIDNVTTLVAGYMNEVNALVWTVFNGKSTAGTSGTLLRSDGTNIVNTTATYPTTTTANQLLYSSATDTVGGLATANSSVLVTNGSGVPSFGTTLPSGLTTNSLTTDDALLITGSSDATKKLRFEVDGITTATTRVATPPDYDFRVMSQTKGADVASAATLNLDTVTGDLVDVTGTTTITAITLAEGKSVTVRFTGALTLTHGASLVLPGSKNIITVAGDIATFRGYAAGVVRCSAYQILPGLIYEAPTTLTAITAVNLPAIPAGVRRVTLMFSQVSTNGTDPYLIQLGTGGTATNTGYLGSGVSGANAASPTVTGFSTGFGIPGQAAAGLTYGTLTFTLFDTAANTWVASGVGSRSDAAIFWNTSGTVTLSGALDFMRLTTTAGTNTFDSGTINIMYER